MLCISKFRPTWDRAKCFKKPTLWVSKTGFTHFLLSTGADFKSLFCTGVLSLSSELKTSREITIELKQVYCVCVRLKSNVSKVSRRNKHRFIGVFHESSTAEEKNTTENDSSRQFFSYWRAFFYFLLSSLCKSKIISKIQKNDHKFSNQRSLAAKLSQKLLM